MFHATSHYMLMTMHFLNCCVDEKAVNRLRELQVRTDDFDRIKLIGKGAYGAVQLVSDC